MQICKKKFMKNVFILQNVINFVISVIIVMNYELCNTDMIIYNIVAACSEKNPFIIKY
jgi:hypothetical protein